MEFGVDNRRPVLGMKPVDQRAVWVRIETLMNRSRRLGRDAEGDHTEAEVSFELGRENQAREERKATGNPRSVLDKAADGRKELGQTPTKATGLGHNLIGRPPMEQRYKGDVEEPEQGLDPAGEHEKSQKTGAPRASDGGTGFRILGSVVLMDMVEELDGGKEHVA
jgi:hypothetical protein